MAKDISWDDLVHSSLQATVANGQFEVIRNVPPRTDAPPRPDLRPPGQRSIWWVEPPHTGLTGRMLPATPGALDWGPKRAATWTS